MTQLAGIINLTPDSFSGDGLLAPKDALNRIDAMIGAGASIIDIGAESTRPGATLLSAQEEGERILPLLELLGTRVNKARFSIDTRHYATASAALQAGFRLINDVSAGGDEAMIELARSQGATLIFTHSLTIPADPTYTLPSTCDPVESVIEWGEALLRRLEQAGIPRMRVILDPGIGFGKTAQQSFALIKHIARLKTLGAAVMVGHSRKSFLKQFALSESTRDQATLILSQFLASQGVDFLRVHNVEMHANMLRILEAL